MSPEQIRLARAVLGLPNDGRQSTHNLFFAEAGTSSVEEWDELRVQGFAARIGTTSSGTYYRLTRAGADRALRPGERLDPLHFPPIGAH